MRLWMPALGLSNLSQKVTGVPVSKPQLLVIGVGEGVGELSSVGFTLVVGITWGASLETAIELEAPLHP